MDILLCAGYIFWDAARSIPVNSKMNTCHKARSPTVLQRRWLQCSHRGYMHVWPRPRTKRDVYACVAKAKDQEGSPTSASALTLLLPDEGDSGTQSPQQKSLLPGSGRGGLNVPQQHYHRQERGPGDSTSTMALLSRAMRKGDPTSTTALSPLVMRGGDSIVTMEIIAAGHWRGRTRCPQ